MKGLEKTVEWLADPYAWNWTEIRSNRDSADHVLSMLARQGLIEHRDHPFGGHIWRVGNKLFGRTDDITFDQFDKLESSLVRFKLV